MKFYLGLLLVFALVASVFAQTPINAQDSRDCSKKAGGAVLNAIGKYCQNKNIKVPSPAAQQGMFSNDGTIQVRITGNCQPQQWVPQEWCFRQFYNICKNGNARGSRVQWYGNNRCQQWSILDWK